MCFAMLQLEYEYISTHSVLQSSSCICNVFSWLFEALIIFLSICVVEKLTNNFCPSSSGIMRLNWKMSTSLAGCIFSRQYDFRGFVATVTHNLIGNCFSKCSFTIHRYVSTCKSILIRNLPDWRTWNFRPSTHLIRVSEELRFGA